MNKIFKMEVAVCKVVDKEGNVLLRLENPPNICKLIMSSKKGMEGCNFSCGATNALVKEKDKPVFITCHAGFVGFYFPIIIDNQKMGGITGCLAMIAGVSEKEIDKEISKRCQTLAEKYELNKEELE